jgi:hypothetical protein
MMEEELVVQQNENGESVVTLGGETVRTYKAGYSPSVMQDEIKRLQESLNKVQDYLATNATPPQNVVDALYKSTRSGVSRNIFTRLFGKLQENAINNLMAEEAKKYEKKSLKHPVEAFNLILLENVLPLLHVKLLRPTLMALIS